MIEQFPWEHHNTGDCSDCIPDSEEAVVVEGRSPGAAASGAPTRTIKETLEKAWADVMQGTVPAETVADWEIFDRRLNLLRADGGLREESNGQLDTEDPPHRNLQDSKIMPTPSELAFLRAARNCTEEEFGEWLNVVKDPAFKSLPTELRFTSAKQAKRYLQRTAANFCNLAVQQHEFKTNDRDPPPRPS